jgi:hypothetical protein
MGTEQPNRLCEGKTKRGTMCHNPALPGRPYCVYHDTDLPPHERRPVTWRDIALGRERDPRVRGRGVLGDGGGE